MRTAWTIAIAVSLFAGAVAAETPEQFKKRAVLLGEMAYMVGGCERYFPKETADSLVSKLTGADGDAQTAAQRYLAGEWTKAYAAGRKDPDLAKADQERCLGLIKDVQKDIDALDKND